jgi:Flp pilus assembly protein TadD
MYSLAGTQMARIGRAEDATDTISVAYSTFQGDAVVLNNFALSADSLGDSDQAFTVLQQVVALRPDYARGWFNLGVLAFHKGNGPVAHAAFGQAAKLGITVAKSALAAYYSAVLYANEGYYGRALALLDSARVSLPPRERAEASRMARQVVAIMRRATKP